MKKWLIAVVELFIILNTAFIIYMIKTQDMTFNFKFRFYTFSLQHIFTFFVILVSCCFDLHHALDKLNWAVFLTVGNFALFGAAQIYLATIPETKINFSDQKLIHGDIGVLAYIHLYYQMNIYFGIFSVFSVILCIVYRVYEQNHI